MRAVPRQKADGPNATPDQFPPPVAPARPANDERQPSAGPPASDVVASARLRLLARQQTVVLQMLASLLDATRLDTALLSLADELHHRFRCTRVVIALGNDHLLQVRAVSQQASLDRRSGEIKRLERVLAASLQQESTLDWPTDDDGGVDWQALRELAAAAAATQILVVPLFHRERRIGAIVITHDRSDSWSRVTRDLFDGLSHPVAAAIALHRDAARGPLRRVADSAEQALARIVPVRHPLRIAGIAAALIGVTFLGALDGVHRVVADSDVQPVRHHVLAAPFDGFVADVGADAGDLVEEGEVLLRLDTRALELERARLQGERDSLDSESRAAMAIYDRAELARLGALRRKAEAELHRLQTLIDQAVLRAPVPGRVLSADLSERVGTPVERGEALVSFAAHDRFELQLLVDERDVAWIEPGQTGRLILNATPDHAYRFTVDSVRPIAIAADGRNRFPVDAHFEEVPSALLSGQTGIGRIDAGEARLGWIYTRRWVDWMRRTSWRWFG